VPPRRAHTQAQAADYPAAGSLLSEEQRKQISDLLVGSSSNSLRSVFPPSHSDQFGPSGKLKSSPEAQEPSSHLDYLASLLSKSHPFGHHEMGKGRPYGTEETPSSSFKINDLLGKYIELYDSQQRAQQMAASGAKSRGQQMGAPGEAHNSLVAGDYMRPPIDTDWAQNNRMSSGGQQMQLAKGKAKRNRLAAESVAGQFSSMGKRRRRRRQVDDERHELGTEFVRMQQVLTGGDNEHDYNLSTSHNGTRPVVPLFTHGTVEMYHTNCDKLDERLARFRRDVAPIAEPTGEELIVQSIKIVDRMQFELEQQQQQQQQQATRGRPKASRELSDPVQQAPKQHNPTPNLSNDMEDFEELPAPRSASRLFESGSAGAIGIVLVAICFIFVQVSMVLVCLIDQRFRRPSSAVVGSDRVHADQVRMVQDHCRLKSEFNNATIHLPTQTSSPFDWSTLSRQSTITRASDNLPDYPDASRHNRLDQVKLYQLDANVGNIVFRQQISTDGSLKQNPISPSRRDQRFRGSNPANGFSQFDTQYFNWKG